MTMITLHWQKCIKNSLWCQCNEKLLNDGRLESRLGDHSVGISGVYVLWTGIDNRTVLKVGSGLSKINWQHISETLKFKPMIALGFPMLPQVYPMPRPPTHLVDSS